jgi:thiol-disulfide isomerase/thioredoxin
MRWLRDERSVAAALCIAGAVLAGAALLLWPNGAGILSGRQPPTLASSTVPREPFPAKLEFTPLPTPRAVPALAFVDGEGAPKTLADFKGRVVLLNIWATWCVPCRAEMSALDRLQAKLGGPDFQVVALSIDRKGLDVVKPFYAELGLGSLGIYLDRSGSAAHALDTVGVPTTLLIDRDGRELGRKLGPAAWDEPDAVALIQRAIEGPR